MENEAGWHGIATKTEEQFEQAIKDIGCPYFIIPSVKKLNVPINGSVFPNGRQLS